ncbi:MAG: hypothetical protein U5M23_08680 [Marinagarivorans sp.]|nr:hypothetical protein [Marinagarivorans sp.]
MLAMPGYEVQELFLDHQRPPSWFWTGETKMRCLAQAIGQSLEHAYAHHIQRLMVIGNFALLAGLNPKAVHGWYLGVYIDAFEWVELPNTVGMSYTVDGGRACHQKPHASSAAYIDLYERLPAAVITDVKGAARRAGLPVQPIFLSSVPINWGKLCSGKGLNRIGRITRWVK